MKKVLSFVIIFLLIFSYGLPSYATVGGIGNRNNNEECNEKESHECDENANLWITVDDGYELYVNGIEVGSDIADSDDSWNTIDTYHIVPATDVNETLIAVKGADQGDDGGGRATISGFTLAYKDSNGEWLITDENWQIFYNDEDIPPEKYHDGQQGYEWYEKGYKSDDWVNAHEILELDSDWPDEHPYLFDAADAQWIWSDNYKVNQSGPFDSPVYFRTMVSKLPDVNITTDIEHNKVGEGDNDLENSYQKLVLLAQLRTFMPTLPSNLRNNILIGDEDDLIHLNYSLMTDRFETMIETNPVHEEGGVPAELVSVPDALINYMALEAGVIENEDGEVIASMDNVIIDYNDDNPKTNPTSDPEWHTVSYTGDFVNPVVIAQLSSRTGGNHSHIRIRNVNPVDNTFEIYIEEWDEHRDTNHHNFELVSYLVIEEGVHRLDGNYVEVIKAADPESIEEKTYEFSRHYVDPSVFTQTQTYEDEDQVWMRQNNIQSNSVDVVKQNQSYMFIDPSTLYSEDYLIVDPDNGDGNGNGNGEGRPIIQPHGEEVIGIVVIADERVSHEVKFFDGEGNSFKVENVFHGESVEEPVTNPTLPGHEFIGWTLVEIDWTSDDVPGPYEAYDFDSEVVEDIELYPYFGYKVEFDKIGMGTIEADVDSVAINSDDIVEKGKNVVFTATPNSGYEIVGWTKNDTPLVSIATTYPVNGLDESIDVVVEFMTEYTEENGAPVANDDEFDIYENEVLNSTVLFSDPNGDPMTVALVTGPSNGTLTFNSDGSFSYTPGSNFTGQDSFTFLANDGYTNGNTATITINVLPVNEEEGDYRVTFGKTGMGTIGATVDSVPIDSGDYVDEGKDVVFTAEPAAGYWIAGWTENGTSGGSISTTYGVVDLDEDIDVIVEFMTEGPEEPEQTNYYMVTYGSSGNGSIIGESEEGTFESEIDLVEGSDLVFTADPVSGNRVKDWIINREPIGSTSTTYVINDLDSEVTVEVQFEVIPTTPTTTGGGGGGTTPRVNARSDEYIIFQNEVLEVETSELMDNDSRVDAFVSVQDPDNGTVTLEGTTVTFTPDEDFLGSASFRYTVRGDGGRDSTSVTVEVIEEETTPLGNGDPKAFLIIEPDIVPLGIIDYSLPYIIGYPDNTFRPDRQVTRAEMAAIFARILALDLTNPGQPMYDDVPEDEWYYRYVQSVTRVGLFSGYEGNSFKPDRPVSHAEIATAFSRYWELKGIEIETNGDSYTDIEGHWAQEMINRLYNAGISASYADGQFKPDAFTTRTELVVMVNRSLNRAEMIKEVSSFRDVLRTFWGFGAIEAATGYVEPESVKLDE